MCAEFVRDHFIVIQVVDRREIQKGLSEWEIGNIRNPFFLRTYRLELSVQQVF